MAGGPARSRIVRPGSGSPSECYRFHSLLAFPAGVAQLITHRYPSERFVAALGPPAPEEIKALIEWGAPSAPAGETVMADDIQYAPGWPGIPPRWTSSAKSAVATALSPMSRVWFTLSHGIFNEIYFRAWIRRARATSDSSSPTGASSSPRRSATHGRRSCPSPRVSPPTG